MIVVDASVLVDALIDHGALGATARLTLSTDAEWVAPTHVVIEVAAVLRKYWQAGRLDQEAADTAIDELGRLNITYVDPAALLPTAWAAAFVAAAERLRCTLVTSDSALAAIAGPRCPITLVTT